MRSIQSITLAFLAAALLIAGCAAQKPKTGDTKSQSQTQKDSGSKAPASAASGQQPKPAAQPSGSNASPEVTRTASATSDAAAGGGGRAQTPDERRAALDKQLEGSLGTFDDTLRREQKAVAEEKDANDAAASGSSDSSSESTSGDESGSAKPEGPPAGASEPGRSRNETPARPGDLKSDKDRAANDANKPGGGTGAAPEKIPDGSDDDIVAKRLRKAAEQETDPELKEKLWKEYIEYKKNAGK